MSDYVSIFKGNESLEEQQKIIDESLRCLDNFAEAFTNEDLRGMDICCHFPHYIISGSDLICWEEAGQLTSQFFDDLKAGGFLKTVVDYRDVILVSENKVHFKYGYSRIHKDGSVISRHDNVWIVTYKNDRWGIQIRSY